MEMSAVVAEEPRAVAVAEMMVVAGAVAVYDGLRNPITLPTIIVPETETGGLVMVILPITGSEVPAFRLKPATEELTVSACAVPPIKNRAEHKAGKARTKSFLVGI
jgi:uncharacterized protein (DUF2062 family)